ALNTGLNGDIRLTEDGYIAELQSLLEKCSDWDLVLLDMNMPGANGFFGLVLLRSKFTSLSVIVVAAQEEAAVVRRARDFGASGFIPKSSSLEIIQSSVQDVLDGDTCWPSQVDDQVSPLSSEQEAISSQLASLTPQQFRVLSMVCDG